MSDPVWVLNLDGDDELRDGRPRDVHAALERRPLLLEALAPLLGGGSHLARGARALQGALGLAFCATPSARARLLAAGARPAPTPDLAVLRHVADRRFAAALPGGIPGALVAKEVADVERALADPGHEGFVLKRLFGFAGRGRRLAPPGPLDAATAAFVARALDADGALVVEPWMVRTGDFGIHGFLEQGGAVAGALHLGRVTVQTVSGAGTWQASRLASEEDLPSPLADRLRALALDGANALRDAGYFGPFGLDAIRWRGEGGERLGRCEINARYTMGWALGMGELRPDLSSIPRSP